MPRMPHHDTTMPPCHVGAEAGRRTWDLTCAAVMRRTVLYDITQMMRVSSTTPRTIAAIVQ